MNALEFAFMSRISIHPQELRLQNQHRQSTDTSYICMHINRVLFPHSETTQHKEGWAYLA